MWHRDRLTPGGSVLWLLAAPLAIVLTLTGTGVPEHRNERRPDEPGLQQAAVPVAVKNGRASFRIPGRSAGAQSLVVVSSLAMHPGPFPIEVAARPTASGELPRPGARGRGARPRLRPHRPEPIKPPPASQPPRERDFHLMARGDDVTDAANYLAVRGVLSAIGRHVQVYVAAEDSHLVDQNTLQDVVSTFDSQIVPAAAATVGLTNDTDGDGRFTILFSSWLSRLGGGRHAVDGFVRVTDLDDSFRPPFGNRCDMMYLSTALKSGAHLRTILAHEYMHGVVFSKKSEENLGPGKAAIEEEGWLDEALAHLFEDQLGFSRSNIAYRVSAFLSQPEHYQLVVDDYYAADLFRSHGNRGSTYLFMKWCLDQFGPELIATLVHSPLRGVANLEAATGRRFDDLYRRWSVDLFLRGLNSHGPGSKGRSAREADSDSDVWPIAGPRPHWLTPDGSPAHWRAAGTSSHFVLVPSPESGAVEVTVTGPPDAALQVTVVPLPEDVGRLELSLQSLPAPSGDIQVQATVRQHGGLPVTLRTLAWEPLVPPADPHVPDYHPGRMDWIQSGDAAIASAGLLRSKPITLTGTRTASEPVVLKLIGEDARGRTISAWATLEHPARPTQPVSRPLASTGH